jgi:hypothetical protein
MTARLVGWLGRTLLHERTVALIIEPALADFSFETATCRAAGRAPARLGPWMAFGLAIWHDLLWDPRGPAWGRSARVLASMALVVTSYHASMLTLILGFDSNLRSGFAHQVAAAISGQQQLLLLTAMVFAAGVIWAVRHAHGAGGTR